MESSKVDELWKRFESTGHRLRLLVTLSDGEQNRVAEANAILSTVQTLERRNKYKLFLFDILRASGPAAVLICAVGLGQGRLTAATASVRRQLAQRIHSRWSDISNPALDQLAAAHRIPRSSDDPPLSIAQESLGPQPGDRRRGNQRQRLTPIERIDAIAASGRQESVPSTRGTLFNIHELTSNQEQRVRENATVDGVNRVFDGYLCRAIRKVVIENELKAAVTTVLPLWGGPVDCLISLDICDDAVEHLARILFNAEVKWVEYVLHVVLDTGITLIISSSEATLKGVSDEKIIEVFGREIFNAINESPVRKRELNERKKLTECVSMILTKSGAIINLSLGLEGGLGVQNKLYN